MRYDVAGVGSAPGSSGRLQLVPDGRTEPTGWICVLSRADALASIATGTLCLGPRGEGRLRRMRLGDGVAVYSPREGRRTGAVVRRFTAVGTVTGVAPYQGDGAAPDDWCRAVDLIDTGGEAVAETLLSRLSFVRDEPGWGVVFRPGFLEVTTDDIAVVREAVLAAPSFP
ncbi:MAG: hypothetical protein PIR53_19130 [Nocardioides alkalitolerans]|jgi:hypothetical protein